MANETIQMAGCASGVCFDRDHAGARRSRAGFTLIEVLVVVAIIALLISILLPSLNKARAQARGVVCASNLRQMGYAGVFYLERYKAYPPARLKEVYDAATGAWEPFVNRYGMKAPRWHWFLDYGVGPVISPDNVAAGKMEMTNDYFICPSLTGEHARSTRNGAYGMNWQYLGNSLVKVGNEYARFPVRDSLVRQPARTVFVADSRGADRDHGMHSYTLDPPRWASEYKTERFGPKAGEDGEFGHSPVEMRHSGDRGNVLFADGHVEGNRLESLGYAVDDEGITIPNGPRASNHLWTGAGSDPQALPAK